MGACLRAGFLYGRAKCRCSSILMLGLAVALIKIGASGRLPFAAIRCRLIESPSHPDQISASPGWDCDSVLR